MKLCVYILLYKSHWQVSTNIVIYRLVFLIQFLLHIKKISKFHYICYNYSNISNAFKIKKIVMLFNKYYTAIIKKYCNIILQVI